MSKEAVFTMKLEPELRSEFMAAAEAAHRPASQVLRELMREFIRRQQLEKDHSEAEMGAANLLDQMAQHLLEKKEIEFSDCVLDWHRKGFQCGQVPRPKDKNKIHLAIKASIVERLVEVLNAPPHLGSQIIPAWCNQIEAIDFPLKLQSDRLLEGEQYCAAFSKRNLLVARNFMYFV